MSFTISFGAGLCFAALAASGAIVQAPDGGGDGNGSVPPGLVSEHFTAPGNAGGSAGFAVDGLALAGAPAPGDASRPPTQDIGRIHVPVLNPPLGGGTGGYMGTTNPFPRQNDDVSAPVPTPTAAGAGLIGLVAMAAARRRISKA